MTVIKNNFHTYFLYLRYVKDLKESRLPLIKVKRNQHLYGSFIDIWSLNTTLIVTLRV